MNTRHRAKQLLIHYLSFIAKNKPFDLEHANHEEIGEIVECIIDAAVKEAVEQIKEELAREAEAVRFMNQEPEEYAKAKKVLQEMYDQHLEDADHWTIGDQQHEDNAAYYREVGEGIKRFQR